MFNARKLCVKHAVNGNTTAFGKSNMSLFFKL